MRFSLLLFVSLHFSGCAVTAVTGVATVAVKSAVTLATVPVVVAADVIEAVIPDGKEEETEED